MSDEYSIDTKYKLGTISEAEYERRIRRLRSLQMLAEGEDALRKQKLEADKANDGPINRTPA